MRAPALLVLVLVSGCTTLREPPTVLGRNPVRCLSAVVGAFDPARFDWGGGTPAILLRMHPETPQRADSLAVVGDSIYFDPAPEALFGNPAPRMLPAGRVLLAVDRQGEVLHGEIPRRFRSNWRVYWLIVRLDEPGSEPLRMVLNRTFGYCLDPGEYGVMQLGFTSGDGAVHMSEQRPYLAFRVAPGVANDLGTWTMRGPDEGVVVSGESYSRSLAGRILLGSGVQHPFGRSGTRSGVTLQGSMADIPVQEGEVRFLFGPAARPGRVDG
jgi:hypothetical protein